MSLWESTDFEQRYYLLEESQLLKGSENCTLFKAFDDLIKCNVFIKIFPPDTFTINDVEKIQKLAKVQHSNIVSLLNFFYLIPPPHSVYIEPLPILVMNHINGLPLSTLTYTLSWSTIDNIWDQLVSALNYFHEQGWVHRDVKLENVLIQDIGGMPTVILCDIEQAGRISTIPESLIGTPEYMAPGAAAWHSLETQFDFWSLGCMLYELLTGELPFGKRDFSLDPLEGINQIQERIKQTDLRQMISRVPVSFQSKLANYWVVSQK